MASRALTREEGWGLALSIAAHAALVGLLVLRPHHGDVVMPPERVEVTLSDEVGLTSTSPDLRQDARADIAPVIGEASPPEPEAAKPEPPIPVAKPAPAPVPRAIASPRPIPTPAPSPRPSPVAKPAPKAVPVVRPVAKPAERPAPSKQPATTSTARTATKPATRPGGSRLGRDFLDGTPGGQGQNRTAGPPAAAIGPQVRSALSGAITRQLKPRWIAPQGADAEQLVTILAWDLDREGRLTGTPRVVSQQGITDANRAQALRHAEQAIRAVQLAAPFNLPAEYYEGWKHIVSFRFDKRLSQ